MSPRNLGHVNIKNDGLIISELIIIGVYLNSVIADEDYCIDIS